MAYKTAEVDDSNVADRAKTATGLESHTCPRCNLGSGQRGCGTCGGTGSVFFICGTPYPNTEDGYKSAKHHERLYMRAMR
jgi:hypothetical protein